jgi:hypothetical protein
MVWACFKSGGWGYPKSGLVSQTIGEEMQREAPTDLERRDTEDFEGKSIWMEESENYYSRPREAKWSEEEGSACNLHWPVFKAGFWNSYPQPQHTFVLCCEYYV